MKIAHPVGVVCEGAVRQGWGRLLVLAFVTARLYTDTQFLHSVSSAIVLVQREMTYFLLRITWGAGRKAFSTLLKGYLNNQVYAVWFCLGFYLKYD